MPPRPPEGAAIVRRRPPPSPTVGQQQAELLVDVGERALHGERPPLEIDVPPAEAEPFGLSEPGSEPGRSRRTASRELSLPGLDEHGADQHRAVRRVAFDRRGGGEGALAQDNLLDRILEPEELGPMAARLAAPESGGITGRVISVGGRYKV